MYSFQSYEDTGYASCIALLLVFFLSLPTFAEDSTPLSLFVNTSASSIKASSIRSENLNQVILNLDKDTLRKLIEENVNKISVSIFGKDVDFNKSHSSISGKFRTWSGKDSSGQNEISLTISEDHLFGNVKSKEEEVLFKPGTQPFEIIQLKQDQTKEVDLDNSSIAEPLSRYFSNRDQASLDITGDDGTRIDVMVLYTNGMSAAYPGSLIDTRIQYLIDQTNLAFTNSHIDTQLRLVRSKMVNYVDDSLGGFSEALYDLTNNLGVFDGIEEERDAYGADQVTLLRTYVDEGCGYAWVIKFGGASFSYAVVHDGFKTDGSGYYCPDLTYAHESGHNLGSAHDRANARVPGYYSYSYGHQSPATPFRTVMAYNCSGVNCPRVAHFSNPDVDYQGDPTGIPETQANSANNAKSINLRRTVVANFRPEVEFNSLLKRSEISKYILLAKNGYSYNPASSASGTVFDDVASSGFNADWIEELFSQGITEGCGGSGGSIYYCPNQIVNREQIAKIVLKAKHGSSYDPPSAQGGVFSDVSVSSFNAKWIEALSDQGITSGCGGGNYCPKDTLSIEAFFNMLAKAFP